MIFTFNLGDFRSWERKRDVNIKVGFNSSWKKDLCQKLSINYLFYILIVWLAITIFGEWIINREQLVLELFARRIRKDIFTSNFWPMCFRFSSKRTENSLRKINTFKEKFLAIVFLWQLLEVPFVIVDSFDLP